MRLFAENRKVIGEKTWVTLFANEIKNRFPLMVVETERSYTHCSGESENNGYVKKYEERGLC